MSDSLFARPSFLGGAARVLDLFGNLQEYNRSLTPELVDQRAMLSDLRAIGSDFKQVIERSAANEKRLSLL